MCRRHMRALLGTGLVIIVASAMTAALAPAALAAVTSGSWAGYAAHSITYTSVTATWAQPSMTCGSGTSGDYAAPWAGLDGYASDTIEQAGTIVECAGGTAEYDAWYDLYPAAPVYLSESVRPGDSITTTVSATTKDVFTITIHNVTAGWSFSTHQTDTAASRTSAEVILEASVPGLATRHTLTFTGAHVNGGTLGAANPTLINSTYVTCGSITGGGTQFSCTW